MKMKCVYKKLASRVSVQLTGVEIERGEYSVHDVDKLQDDRDSWMAAFLKFSDNHDRLTEENAKLLEVLSSVIESIKNSDDSIIANIDFLPFIKADLLLNQLKDQNNG